MRLTVRKYIEWSYSTPNGHKLHSTSLLLTFFLSFRRSTHILTPNDFLFSLLSLHSLCFFQPILMWSEEKTIASARVILLNTSRHVLNKHNCCVIFLVLFFTLFLFCLSLTALVLFAHSLCVLASVQLRQHKTPICDEFFIQ